MKKLIGVVIILVTLLLTMIYRQLTHRPATDKPPQAYVPVSMREGIMLTYLLLQ